ncbi:MAG: hypothetical protein CMF74_03690 [Maricaulis sp.]|jgi:NAD(P)-dependent dehydrogenase (short-subunit alcohol dehydrogenase family)|nr:hypothetical protein [Maricaulis sp.]|tara:strand:- start:246 stop:998 length:753 start_codon:yes stop_codon:yes gene_type:complete
MTGPLTGKRILVTGASRGAGRAIAAACAAQGGQVVVHYNQQRDSAEALADELGEFALGVIGHDLGKADAGAHLWQEAEAQFGPLDALVNNAGIYRATPLNDDAQWGAGWSEQLAVNLRAPCDLMRAAINTFRARGGGSIVNIASRAAYRGDGPDHAGYAAVKAGLVAAAKTLARAHSGEGILIYTLTPGWIETDMAPSRVEARRAAVAEIPLGAVAQPEEIGAVTAFLLTGACPSATGTVMDINGASYVR